MKYLLLNITLVCVFISGINVYAQEVQLATLQQGDNMQAFYGADALKNALAAADNGDLITLSAGNFNSPTIEKAVIIQGAGYVTDIENGRYPTVILGNTNIQLQETDEGLTIEGIIFNTNVENRGVLVSAVFKKCRFNYLNLGTVSGAQTKLCLIDQCRFSSWIYPDQISEGLYIKNSIIYSIGSNSSTATVLVENCIVYSYAASTTAIYRNNVIFSVNTISSFSSAYNNVSLNGNANHLVNQSGNMASDANTLFGYVIDYDDNKTYELTPEAQATFLGTDGRQVGIYGGETPFTNVPTNPQITKREIDGKSSLDGKLKVNITVEAQN